MTNILLIILIIFIGADIALNTYKNIIKPRRKVKPDKQAIENAKKKRREFENFMSYSGDEQH